MCLFMYNEVIEEPWHRENVKREIVKPWNVKTWNCEIVKRLLVSNEVIVE